MRIEHPVILEDTLANHTSAIKRHKQSLKRAIRNRAARTRIKNVVKAVRLAVESKDREAAASALTTANSVLDKYAGKAVHWKNASRKMSRLAQSVNAME
jgi:small subunit ribosomal protein S20